MGRRGKKSKAKRIITWTIVGIVAAVIISLIVYVAVTVQQVKADINGGQGSEGEIEIIVELGDTVEDVLAKLQKEGIVSDTFYSSLAFRLKANEYGLGTKLQANEDGHKIPQNASYQEIFDILSTPPEARESVRISFPEGCEVSDVIELFLKNGIGSEEGFEIALDYDYGYYYLPAPGTASRLEGFLYPDTYDFFVDATEVEVISKMLKQFDNKLNAANIPELAQQADMTVYEALTLASIIQKESGKLEDFHMISSVFHNRLDSGWKLESDAATSYPIPKSERLPSCTYEQLEKDTPYNVYKRKGLTPTPICNPRIEAVTAACQPAESDYFFFIGYNDENGAQHTVFAVTYAEHQKNINKYLK